MYKHINSNHFKITSYEKVTIIRIAIRSYRILLTSAF